jgi:hypothetical protein
MATQRPSFGWRCQTARQESDSAKIAILIFIADMETRFIQILSRAEMALTSDNLSQVTIASP